MSTRVKDRKNNNKFEILTKITNLCGRTRDIVNHEKFNANVALRTDLINSAEAIYFFARRANRYRTDRTKEELLKRRELQNKAIDRCDWFFGEVQETKPVFHLRTKQVESWGRQIEEVQDALRAWRDGDADRWRTNHR